MKVALRYLPKTLTRKDKKTQYRMLTKSRALYKKGKYYTRKRVASFSSKKSKFITRAQKIYNVDKIGATPELARATGCSRAALAKIINKGQGAYYSSGSRPNQTAQSWGNARLASTITAGKAAAVDYDIINTGCDHKKKAYILANKSRRQYKHGQSRTRRVIV